MRGAILDGKPRIDGRDTKTVRPISVEVGVLPRAHGSALFTRGETQALVVATLGTGQDEQIVDALEGEFRAHFMLHYNFPPYATGETGRMGSPGRREIGHGKLAWRAVHPLLPEKEKFPYTIRVVSEITESNGSSSMASVCGASLSLMDAGVPLARPVAGIAMGLIKEGDKFAVLSDILGDEDHLGDMDFKVAGTAAGRHRPADGHQDHLDHRGDHARGARIRPRPDACTSSARCRRRSTAAREGVSSNAPRITTITIPKDKIREVIGSGGKVIREICEVTGAKIDIEDDGTIKVAAVDADASKAAIDWIRGIVAEPELGVIYTGKVVKTVDFGAFVNFLGARDGLVHISELAPQRVGKTTDIVKVGDQVKVKVLGFDDRGKVKLSMKQVDQATGEDIGGKLAEERRHREDTKAAQPADRPDRHRCGLDVSLTSGRDLLILPGGGTCRKALNPVVMSGREVLPWSRAARAFPSRTAKARAPGRHAAASAPSRASTPTASTSDGQQDPADLSRPHAARAPRRADQVLDRRRDQSGAHGL